MYALVFQSCTFLNSCHVFVRILMENFSANGEECRLSCCSSFLLKTNTKRADVKSSKLFYLEFDFARAYN